MTNRKLLRLEEAAMSKIDNTAKWSDDEIEQMAQEIMDYPFEGNITGLVTHVREVLRSHLGVETPLPASQESRQNCRHCGKEEPNYAAMTAQAAAYSQIGCPKNSSGMHIWESTISSTPAVPVEPRQNSKRCMNCGHANPHDNPAGSVNHACTEPGCNCGFYVTSASIEPPATLTPVPVVAATTCPHCNHAPHKPGLCDFGLADGECPCDDSASPVSREPLKPTNLLCPHCGIAYLRGSFNSYPCPNCDQVFEVVRRADREVWQQAWLAVSREPRNNH